MPADRFTTVSDFLRALDTPAASMQYGTTGMSSATAPATHRPRKTMLIGGVAVAAIVTVVAVLGAMGKFKRVDTSAALRDRTQLTFTGNISAPALSADGKQLAYFMKSCTGPDCRYSITVQDVGSTTTRQVLDGATAVYGLEWSPDRRNVLMNGTVAGRLGTYVVSALGGPPRFLTPGVATFYAGGDSLLIGPVGPSDSTFTVRVAGLDGTVRDSVRVPGPGGLLASLVSIPGTTRFVAMVIQAPRGLWQVFEQTASSRTSFSMPAPAAPLRRATRCG